MISQFNIREFSQVQRIDSKEIELQPNHLMCDQCWSHSDSAFSHALIFGGRASASGNTLDPVTFEQIDDPCGMTVKVGVRS